MEEYVQVGKVKDAHGIKGELFIVLFAGEAAWLPKLNEIRLVEGASRKTLTAKSVRLHKNGLIAKTTEITDRNEAENLKGWLFEIPASFLVSEAGEEIYLREVHGFKVITKAQGEVGTIVAFGTNGLQDLLIVKTGWGEFEIPFVEPFVESIDYEAREMRMDLPEGLLGELEAESDVEQERDEK